MAISLGFVLAGCGLTDGTRYAETAITTPLTSLPPASRRNLGEGGGAIYDPAATGSTDKLYPGNNQFVSAAGWGPDYQSDAEGSITLNLVDVAIPDAAKAVLADILGANYVVDPKIDGKVTIQTTKPVAKDTLVAIFEAALRAKGASLVEDNGFFRIVPADQAATSAGQIIPGADLSDGGPGNQVRVVPLQYVAAGEMEQILRPIAPQGAVLRADTARNLLILSGNQSELSAMLDAIRIFDVDWMRGKSFGLFRVESSDPADVVRELEAIFATETQGSGKGLVQFIANRRLKAVLVISARAAYLNKAAEWIRRVDTLGSANDRRLYIYHIQNRPAGELAKVLQRIYAAEAAHRDPGAAGTPEAASTDPASGTDLATGTTVPAAADSTVGGSTATGSTTTTKAVLGRTARDLGSAAAPLPAAVAGLAEPADETSGAATTGERPKVSIVADETDNSLLIMATPPEYKKVLQILEQIDSVPNQVMLEATIIEVTLNDELKYGLRWFFASHNSDFTFSDLANGAVQSAFPGFSYFLHGADSVKVALNALSAVTDVNVISSPSLMVLDNRTASLQVGDEVPVATQQAVGVQAADAPVVNAISFRNTGVILSVTPRVSDSGRVVLDVEQEVSNVVRTTTSGIDSPTIQQRRVHTTVSVQNGESLTLGGLMQERDTRDRKQVPLLGDIPVVGNLFKQKDDTIARTELLIIITPRVVHDGAEARAIMDEFRSAMEVNLRPDHSGPPTKREDAWRLIIR